MRNKLSMIGIMIATVVILGTTMVSAAATADEPSIGIPVLIPNNPTKLSRINFTVDVSGDEDISFVKILVQECNGNTGICHQPENVTMNKIGDITYAQDVTLKYSDTTYITYWVGVEYGGLWINNTGIKLDLSTSQPPNNNETNGSGGNTNTSTPGFELVVVIGAIAVSLILVGRKRSR